MTDKQFVAGVYGLSYVISITMGVVALVYGFADDEDPCQEGRRGGLNLSDMTKGYGFRILIGIHLLGVVLCLSDSLFVIVMGLTSVFDFIWMVWTIVVLSTNENNNCVAQGSDMAIICIIYAAFSFMFFCCGGGKYSTTS